jgi:hypothetical protein
MSIKTNHSSESLTPESGVLTVDSDGAIKLPVGPVSARPTIGVQGYVRFAETDPEYHDGTDWRSFASKNYVESQLSLNGQTVADVIANLSLDSLTDVTVSYPSDGQVLAYDSMLGQFRSQNNVLTPITRTFTGDGTTLEFDIINSVSSVNNLVVTVNGVTQEPFYSYTIINGNIVAFDEAPEDGDRIQVRILRSNTTTDRPRPKVLNVSYTTINNYIAITIVVTDITYGTGARINEVPVTRIDYISQNTLQLMVENTVSINTLQGKDLTLVDTSGNEFRFPNLINYGNNLPYWTNSNSYIGTFSGGDAINYTLGVSNATNVTLTAANASEQSLPWLMVTGSNLTGTAPMNSSPSRYEIIVTASNGSVYITKNFWLLVI